MTRVSGTGNARAAGVLAAWGCAGILRETTLRAHLLAASAVAVPAVGAVGVLRSRSPDRPWRVQEATFSTVAYGLPFLVTLGVVATLFAVAVSLAKRDRRAPNAWLGAVLFTLSTAATVPVFVPDLVPAWRGGVDPAPGPAVWLPILLAPALLTLVVWGASAARRVREEQPARVEV